MVNWELTQQGLFVFTQNKKRYTHISIYTHARAHTHTHHFWYTINYGLLAKFEIGIAETCIEEFILCL